MVDKNQAWDVQRILALTASVLWIIVIADFILTSVVTSMLGIYVLAALACFVLLTGLFFAVFSFLKRPALELPIISAMSLSPRRTPDSLVSTSAALSPATPVPTMEELREQSRKINEMWSPSTAEEIAQESERVILARKISRTAVVSR